MKGFISEYVGDKEQYYKPDRYIVSSNSENNKIHISQDMSIVSVKTVDKAVQNKVISKVLGVIGYKRYSNRTG